MIAAHIRDRFFQRYGRELTVDVLREVVSLATRTQGVPDSVPGRERVTFFYDGQEIILIWRRDRRFIFTFLPPKLRMAWCLPKRKKRRT